MDCYKLNKYKRNDKQYFVNIHDHSSTEVEIKILYNRKYKMLKGTNDSLCGYANVKAEDLKIGMCLQGQRATSHDCSIEVDEYMPYLRITDVNEDGTIEGCEYDDDDNYCLKIDYWHKSR